tara:strand:+ start:71 stop:805 length:735 start_codon:yes stop_codon:yes gene_type:complete
MATKNEDLPWIYRQPATRKEVIEGSKTIGGKAARSVNKNVIQPLVNAGKDIYGGLTDTNVRDDKGNLVFNEVTGKPFRQREYNLLGQESFKQSQISNRVDLSDEDALTQELQRLTALSNNAKNDTFASMFTEAAIELQNKFNLYQDEASETTQFKLINSLNETKNEIEKAVNVQNNETKESTIAPKSDQKDLKSEAQARIDFLSKNTPANKAFEEGDYRKADWDEMRWQRFGKPNYESNLLKDQ